MDDFATYQGAYNIFSKVSCIGQTENCIFGAIVDYSKSASFTGSMIGNGAFGAAGYVIGGLLGQERDLRVSRIYDFLFALINVTEYGIGKSVKTITITLIDGNKLHFTANMTEKPLPYQENGMKAFVNKFGKQ